LRALAGDETLDALASRLCAAGVLGRLHGVGVGVQHIQPGDLVTVALLSQRSARRAGLNGELGSLHFEVAQRGTVSAGSRAAVGPARWLPRRASRPWLRATRGQPAKK